MFCCCCSFLMLYIYFQATLPDPWRYPPALRSTPTTFDCLFFFIYRECYGFEWAFFTQGRFLPYTPSWHSGTTCFYQGFTGSRQLFFLKLQGFILILETQTRPMCLFDSQQSTIFYTSSFVFIHINIAKVLLMGRTLVRSAATLFRNHENIRQQPN